jgi:hypothetical protein
MSYLIFYRGLYGPYVLVAILASLLATDIVVNLIGGRGTYESSYYYAALGFVVATVASQVVVWRSRRVKPRLLIDSETGEPTRIEPQQALFMIPVRFWPLICLGLAIVFAILGLLGRQPV